MKTLADRLSEQLEHNPNHHTILRYQWADGEPGPDMALLDSVIDKLRRIEEVQEPIEFMMDHACEWEQQVMERFEEAPTQTDENIVVVDAFSDFVKFVRECNMYLDSPETTDEEREDLLRYKKLLADMGRRLVDLP